MKEIRILKLKRLAIRMGVTIVSASVAYQAAWCLYYAVAIGFGSMVLLMAVLLIFLAFSIWIAWKVRIPL